MRIPFHALPALAGALILLTVSSSRVRAAGHSSGERRPISEFASEIASHSRDEIPSFSRQTGLACSVCHTAFPQLTAFGRAFKLGGYTMPASEQVITQKQGDAETLRLNLLPGLSAMVIASMSSVAKEEPGTQNTNVSFPQELGLFLGGAITPHLGGFLQITYDGSEGSIGLDNVDLRYASRTRVGSSPLEFGFTLNNNPTVQDVWNTVPAWGFPYTSPATAPAPSTTTLIADDLGGQVAGLGGYFLWNGLVYGELDGYRSAPQGSPNPPDGESESTIKGLTPYWRVALQHRFGAHYIELGTFGLSTQLYPEGVTGPTNRYTDFAIDTQYEVPLAGGAFAAHARWIHESQTLDATYAEDGATSPDNTLHSLEVDASWATRIRVDLMAGVQTIDGDPDALLYAPDPVTGSRTGSPASTSITAEVAWRPWLNTRFAARYVFWTEFNGASTDYDGFGRDAGDNDTLYVYTWLAF
ncbi:MAG: hypothetical protein ACWGON_02860 [Gemmatimonadota bacterium]